MQGDGHGFVRIGPDAQGEVVRLPSLAVEHQRERLLVALQTVGDGLEGIGPVYFSQHLFDHVAVVQRGIGKVFLMQDGVLLLVRDTAENNILHFDFPLGQVDGGGVGGDPGIRLPGHAGGDGLEQILVLQGVPVTLVDDVVHAGVIEG